jgi:hypothetical protein
MIHITIQPQDLNPLYIMYFTASDEGKSKNETLNRMFVELDKHIRKQYGVMYTQHTEMLRKEIAKQKKQTR